MLPFQKVYGSLKDKNSSQAYLPLMGASLKAAVRCGAIITICLLIQGIL
jgi:1,4-dihydroxy-2-naphthoate octaprenyltransferase